MTRTRLIFHHIRKLVGVEFTPHEIAKWYGLRMSQVHVAISHLKKRNELVKLRDAEMGRYSKTPSLWKLSRKTTNTKEV